MKFKIRMTWSRYSRLVAFGAGASLAVTPFCFKTFTHTGNVFCIWLGAFTLSAFWIMLYLSHRWAHKKGAC